jgi:hypothetical protein
MSCSKESSPEVAPPQPKRARRNAIKPNSDEAKLVMEVLYSLYLRL